MIRIIAVACLLAGPTLASTPLPTPNSGDCSGLNAARAQARTMAAPLSYQVFDLDGENAIAFQKSQELAERDRFQHMTVMVNPKSGRAAALLNDGPNCGFQSVFAVLTPPYTTAMDAALDLLRLAR